MSAKRRIVFGTAALAAMTLLRCTLFPALAQVPAAGTPGGAQPQIEPPPSATQPPPSPVQPPAETEPAAPRDDGVRMQVRGFRLSGVVDRPKLGIRAAELTQLVEQMRLAKPGGLGIVELREITQAITRYYRAAGVFLARAYIPEQTVKDGIVTIAVLEGKLARVEPVGNALYSDARLREPFEPLIGEPVHLERIERQLLAVNRYPGYAGGGVFQPGERLGDTVLALDTRSESRFSGALWYDNHGTRFTGKSRLFAQAELNNATGAADRASFLALQTLSPTNARFFSGAYQRPVYKPDYMLNAGVSSNTFKVGDVFEQLQIEGNSFIYNVGVSRLFLLSRERTLSGGVDLARKSASSTQSGIDIGTDELTVLTGYGQYEFGVNLLRGSLSVGLPELLGAMGSNALEASRLGGSGARAGGDFSKITVAYSRLLGLPQAELFRNQTLVLRAQAQFSGDLLTSLEQMPLGGPNSVRAYPTSEFLADSAALLSFEWQARSRAPGAGMLRNLRVTAFFDYANGEVNDPLANEDATVSLAGIGGGLHFNPFAKVDAKVELATSLGNPEPTNGKSLQFWFNARYRF